MKLKTIDASSLTSSEMQSYLHSIIAPRPICFASTIDKNGNVNLSPFSFFNVVSIDPPICIFSVTTRAHDNSKKNTLENILEVPECVINIVNYNMVQQTYLTSKEYPKDINEFLKSGLTEIPSEIVKPPRVAESSVQMECLIKDVITLGNSAGSGNLILAEVKRFHIKEDIINENGKIEPQKLDLVARLGGDWYCRIVPENLFKIDKPKNSTGLGIGFDAIPTEIKNSSILTGNNLGLLALVNNLPSDKDIKEFSQTDEMRDLLDNSVDIHTRTLIKHTKAKSLLETGNVEDAWKVLLV